MLTFLYGGNEKCFFMEKNKAPGLDNILVELFQHCRDIVKLGIIAIFNTVHEGNSGVEGLNYVVITLLLKVNDANKI
jgi:hypothetical protein